MGSRYTSELVLFYYPQVNTDLPGKSSFYNFLSVAIILKKLKK